MWRDRLRRAGLEKLEKHGLRLGRSSRLVRAMAAEAIFNLASPMDWGPLTARSYDRNPRYLAPENRNLFDWERDVVDEFFPPPPARILVGAAGGGREMAALADMDFDVAGFEPGPRLAELATSTVSSARLLAIEPASFEDVVEGCASIERLAPYDAVVIGWGSMSHLGSAEVRHRLLAKMRYLCPKGPVLLSWVHDRPGEIELRLRRALARLGVPTREEHEGYSFIGGFSRSYSHEEIFGLANDAGFRVLHYSETQYPHAVLQPRM